MKTAHRVHGNAGKKAHSTQSENVPKNTQGKPSEIKLSVVFEGYGEIELFKLSEDITAAMLERVNKEGDPDIGKAVERALNDSIKAARRGYFPSVEFEEALNNAAAMLSLMESKLYYDTRDKTNPRCPEYNPHVALEMGGYFNMFHQTKKGLLTIYKNVFAWLKAEGEASSR